MKYDVPAVIFSGGSEIVALSVAEALFTHHIPLIVIGMGKRSLIRDLPNVIAYRQITWPPVSKDLAIQELIRTFKKLGQYTQPLPVFPTEDGGLRLLLEAKEALSPFLNIPNTPHLSMGGLDKAEFFEFLKNKGCENYLAPTIVLHSPEEAYKAFEQLGEDVVFKPALKPFSMEMASMSSKVITAQSLQDNPAKIMARLEKAWQISPRWVAQKRLISLSGEALWWGIRTQHGQLIDTTAYERWKQPKMGGSGCWVEMKPISELQGTANTILNALDFHGIAEIPFLENKDNKWQVIEFNPRPWLQVGLPEAAGLPLVLNLYLDMINSPLPSSSFSPKQNVQWVNPERMLIAALSGDYDSKLKALSQAIKVILKADYKTIYSTPFTGIRRRWIARMLSKILQKS